MQKGKIKETMSGSNRGPGKGESPAGTARREYYQVRIIG